MNRLTIRQRKQLEAIAADHGRIHAGKKNQILNALVRRGLLRRNPLPIFITIEIAPEVRTIDLHMGGREIVIAKFRQKRGYWYHITDEGLAAIGSTA